MAAAATISLLTPGASASSAFATEFPPLPKALFPFTMAWTNRSTFQQVIEFTSHASGE